MARTRAKSASTPQAASGCSPHLLGQLGVHGGEFVLAHDLGERAAGQDQFTGRGEFAVLVGQGERAEPGLVAGLQARVPHQREDGVGQLLGVRGVLRPRSPRRRRPARRRRRPAPAGW